MRITGSTIGEKFLICFGISKSVFLSGCRLIHDDFDVGLLYSESVFILGL